MSHQDDLESTYKAASNEQPSSDIDQLIIQAANNALNSNSSQDEANEKSVKSNVIKGRFNLKRWQTPVSIAAAALFTVSFISTYNLWQVDEQDFGQDSLGPFSSESNTSKNKQESKEKAFEDRLEVLEKRAPEDKLSTPASADILSLEDANKKDLKTLPSKKQPKRSQLSSHSSPKALAKPTYDNDEQMTVVVTGSRVARAKEMFSRQAVVETETVSISADIGVDVEESLQLSTEPKIIDIPLDVPLEITTWLVKIENHLDNDKVKNAKAEVVILLKQHPLSSFTQHQRDRFDIINKKIQLALNNENKQ